MGFSDFFSSKGKHTESVVLIDIGLDAVVGAYVHYSEGELPTLIYCQTTPIQTRPDEPPEGGMLRALKTLGETLIREGAPALARATGSGTARMILVSIDSPWQETSVHKEDFEEDEPFVFTQSLVNKRLEESRTKSNEKTLVDESIIGTILNGYHTPNPYGKKAHRASVVVLTSLIERHVASSIITTLERLYHTKNILPIAGSSLRYQAMRDVFPHEQDAIILDATNKSLSSISLVRKGYFVSLAETATSSVKEDWIVAVTKELSQVANQYPLPRTIFLLAREADSAALRDMLDNTHFNSLWVSANPPKVVPVLKTQMTSLVKQTTEVPADIVILLMAVYFQSRHLALEKEL